MAELNPNIGFNGLGGIRPLSYSQQQNQDMNLAAAAQTLKERKLQYQLQQNALQQQVLGQQHMQAVSQQPPPGTQPGGVQSSTPGYTPSGSPVLVRPDPGTPGANPSQIALTGPNGESVTVPNMDAARAYRQKGYYVSDNAETPQTVPPVATPPPAQDGSAAPISSTDPNSSATAPAVPPPDQAPPQEASTPAPDGSTEDQTANPPAPQPEAPAGTPTAQPTEDEKVLNTAPVSVAAAASPRPQEAAPTPAPVATPSVPQTPYQQLAANAGVANPVLQENPWDYPERVYKSMLADPRVLRSTADNVYHTLLKNVADDAAIKNTWNTAHLAADLARHKAASEDFNVFMAQYPTEALRAAAWPAWLRDEGGKLTDQEKAQFQHYPGDDTAKQIASAWQGHVAVSEQILKQRQAEKDQAETQEAQTRTSEGQQKILQAAVADIGTVLGAATNADEYAAARASVIANADDPKLAARALSRFPKVFDPKTTPGIVNRLSITQEQRMKEEEARKNPTTASMYLQRAGGDPAKALALMQADEIAKARASKAVTTTNNYSGPQGEASDFVKAVASYDIQAPTGYFLSKNPGFMDAVKKVNPAYQQANYPVVQKTLEYFNSGKGGDKVQAMNTVADHLSTMYDAVSALDNNDVRVLNQLANAWGVAIGKDPVTTFKTIVHRVGPEMTKVYNSQTSEGENRLNEGDFDPKNSPTQLRDSIKASAVLLGGAFKAMENRWNQGVKKYNPNRDFDLISPEALETFKRLSGGKFGRKEAQAGPGLTVDFKGHTFGPFPDKAAMDKFKHDQGIQ